MIEQVEIVEVLAISNTEGIEISRAREEVDTREANIGTKIVAHETIYEERSKADMR